MIPQRCYLSIFVLFKLNTNDVIDLTVEEPGDVRCRSSFSFAWDGGVFAIEGSQVGRRVRQDRR